MTSAPVTRDAVLAVAAGLRADDPSTAAEEKLDRLVRDVIAGVIATGDDLVDYTAYPTSDDASVTGVLIDVSLTRTDSVDSRSLATVVLASADAEGQLDGSLIVSGLPIDAADGERTLHTSTLTGEVHVSAPVDVSTSGVLRVAVRSGAVPDDAAPTDATPAVPTPRTAAERRAAKKEYDRAVKKSRAAYVKARKKAGSSKRKKAAAKKAYAKGKARAKAAYRAAVTDVPASPSTAPATPPTTAADDSAATTIISTDVGWLLPT